MTLLASVVIPTFNRARRLDLTLASFLHQTDSRFELVVVDDGGSDGTPGVVEAYAGRLPLRFVRQANRGRSAARNAGLRESRGDLLIFCDDDSVASPGFVAGHLAELKAGGVPTAALGWQYGLVTQLERNLPMTAAELLAVVKRRPGALEESRHSEGVLVTPEMIRSDFEGTIRDFSFPEPFWREHVEPLAETYGDDLDGFAIPWSIGLTGNLSAPRRLVEEVGGFDEEFRGWGLEDAELLLKLCLAGARPRILRGPANYHQAHPLPARRLEEWIRNARHFLDKHDSFETWAYITGVFAELGLRKISDIVQAYRRDSSSVLARELARVTREHARLLVGGGG